MTYEEAMKIGTAVDGTVKCTYANIFDPDGNFVFAVHKAGTAMPSIGLDGYDIAGEISSHVGEVYESFCMSKRFVGDKFVPVVLHRKVIGQLRNSMALMVRKRDVTIENSSYDLYDFRIKRRASQIAHAEAGGEFYVRKDAVEWYPLNTKAPDELRKAEADLKRAKQLLAASAVATVI